jgi:hypothetical protein
MKTALIFVSVLLVASAPAQQHDEPHPNGVIYGTAVDKDGNPAKNIGLTACPLGVALSAILPHTTTNARGEYRFENLPWWGRYAVYPEDREAGYSSFSNPRVGNRYSEEAEISPGKPKAELNVVLPDKAGFLRIHLSSQKSGVAIIGMRVALMSAESPRSPLMTMSCESSQVVLLPPNKRLLLHVTSDGFREWSESVGSGKLVELAPGAELTLNVELEPAP